MGMDLLNYRQEISIIVRPPVIVSCERLLAFGQLITEGLYKETGLVDAPR